MLKKSLEKEAESCRELAKEFAGRAEGPFLLRLASVMEELAPGPRGIGKAPGPEASAV